MTMTRVLLAGSAESAETNRVPVAGKCSDITHMGYMEIDPVGNLIPGATGPVIVYYRGALHTVLFPGSEHHCRAGAELDDITLEYPSAIGKAMVHVGLHEYSRPAEAHLARPVKGVFQAAALHGHPYRMLFVCARWQPTVSGSPVVYGQWDLHYPYDPAGSNNAWSASGNVRRYPDDIPDLPGIFWDTLFYGRFKEGAGAVPSLSISGKPTPYGTWKSIKSIGAVADVSPVTVRIYGGPCAIKLEAFTVAADVQESFYLGIVAGAHPG